jgi:hypothetical protein
MRRSMRIVLVALLTVALPCLAADADTKGEVEKLKKELKAAQDKIAELTKERDRLRDRAVAAEIAQKTVAERMRKLEEAVKELSRAVKRGRGDPAPEPAATGRERVEGRVRKVDGRLMALSVGADAGLNKGDTLEVYRPDKPPKYLGRVRVIEVRPKESVAQAVGKMADEVKEGDRAASRLPAK